MLCRRIGVFDSGVGGLTVLRAIREALPDEHIVYFGDTARMPYGDKEPEQIIAYARQITDYLISRGAQVVAAACNTSSALALPVIGRDFDVPLIGMIECGAAAAARASTQGRIGVMATANTVRSGAYARAIAARAPGAYIIQQACPLLVPMVERGEVEGPDIRRALEGYVTPLLEAGVDAIVYGCTHYPFLHREMRSIVGDDVALVDPAREVAAEVRKVAEGLGGKCGSETAAVEFVTSGDPEEFAAVASSLLRQEIAQVSKADLGGQS